MKKILFLITFLFFSVGALEAKPNNKILKIGVTQEFEHLNNMTSDMLATTYIYSMVNRKLVTIGKDWKWKPVLVKKIPDLKNGLARVFEEVDPKTKKKVKRLHSVWEIKESAVWGDGKPVTGHDVKFSWTVGMHPNTPIGEKQVYSDIIRINVDKKNPKKFVMIFEKPKWDFAQRGTFYVLPMHLEGSIFKKYKDRREGYAKNSLYVKKPELAGLYNGPYRVKEVKLGSHAHLVPNEKFWGKKPKIENIIIKLIPNTATLEANLRAGNIDMISIIGLSLDQALAFEKKVKKERLKFDINFESALVYEHVDLQLKNPILKDVNVRKALVYAINREEMVKSLFAGRQKAALHNIAFRDPWFTDDSSKIVKYRFSRRKAKKLLDKAGWKIGKDGYRYKDGKKLSLTFMTTAGRKIRELVQVYLKNQWKKVGIEVSIKNEPARVYFGNTIKKSLYEGLALYAWISSPENTPRSTLHSTNIPTKNNGYKGQNSPNYNSPEMDRLLEEVDVTFDAAKRKELISKILYHYTNDVPVIPLYYRSDISVTPKGLRGYYIAGHQFPSTEAIEEWHF